MPRIKAGEMPVAEIRNLVRQHNKLSVISGVDTKTRKQLIDEIGQKGYTINHRLKRIELSRSAADLVIEQSKSAEPKANKKTRRKQFVKEGDDMSLINGDIAEQVANDAGLLYKQTDQV